MKKLDPKYLGIPNICYSIYTKGDDREDMFAKQRIKRGFDESETWSLTDTICLFTIPRLKEYIKIIKNHIDTDYHKDFIKDCEHVLKTLELLSRDDGIRLFSDEERIFVDDGLKKFMEIFEALWW